MTTEEKKTVESKAEAERRKKPYEKPRLTIHGDVAEITKALGGEGSDGQAGSQGIEAPESDRDAKENFAPVDGRDILKRLSAVPIEAWNYKGEDPSVRHIGPMAQDFAKAFGVGSSDKRIHTIDASGVALASIQALNQMMREKDNQVRALQEQVKELKDELKELKKELAPL